MNKDKNMIKFSSSFLFVLTFVVFLCNSIAFNTNEPDVVSNNFKHVYAQDSVASFANSFSNDNNTLIFNNYENSEMGISLKYPSSFLIDESNSNQTVKQVSFFPIYDDDDDAADATGTYPETYISWFDVYVEIFYPPISDSPVNISSYLEDRANSIQEEDEDVTIIETSNDSMLSGYPAYKLVTQSYSGNYTIYTVEIGTIIGNRLYSLSYEADTADYQKSLPIANEMIYSFKVKADSFSNPLRLLNNSTELATIKEKLPILQGLLAELNLQNLTTGSSDLIKRLNLNSSVLGSLQNFLSNSTSQSSLGLASILNSASQIDLQTLCSIQLLSNLCMGASFSAPSLSSLDNQFLRNENSLNSLAGLLNFSNNATTGGLNLSELGNLLGPFGILPSPSIQSPSSSPFPNNTNRSNSSEGLLDSSTNNTNTNTTFLNNFSVGEKGFINNTNSNSQNSGLPDIIKMLEFLQRR